MPNDHKSIANAIVRDVSCNWIITYDDVPQIEELYKQHPMWEITLRYSISSTSSSGTEIIIFKDDNVCPDLTQFEQEKMKLKICMR
jgi:DNA adenine methylase